MGVEIHERVTAWMTFTGEIQWNDRERRSMDYTMTFRVSARHESCVFGYASAMGDNPPDPEEGELEIPSRLFAAAIRRISNGSKHAGLGGVGAFDLMENGEVRYTTDCGEEHFFVLDDLLVLADIINDEAIIEPIN